MVLAARMIGREMNPEFFLHRSDYDVALIADIIKPLVLVWLGGKGISVAASCSTP